MALVGPREVLYLPQDAAALRKASSWVLVADEAEERRANLALLAKLQQGEPPKQRTVLQAALYGRGPSEERVVRRPRQSVVPPSEADEDPPPAYASDDDAYDDAYDDGYYDDDAYEDDAYDDDAYDDDAYDDEEAYDDDEEDAYEESVEAEEGYDASRYARYKLESRIFALEREGEDAARRAAKRIAALEEQVAALREEEAWTEAREAAVAEDRLAAVEAQVAALRVVRQEPVLRQEPVIRARPGEDTCLPPTYVEDDEKKANRPEARKPPPATTRVTRDAARRAALRRDQYRRERSAMRATEAELELRELARTRRALSAPGPFAGLMRREAEMANRKRDKVAYQIESEIADLRQAKFKAKPPPDFSRIAAQQTDPETRRHDAAARAVALLGESDAAAPRAARLDTSALRAKRAPVVIETKHRKIIGARVKTHQPPLSPKLAYARSKEQARARLQAQRNRFDAFVQFHRQGLQASKKENADPASLSSSRPQLS